MDVGVTESRSESNFMKNLSRAAALGLALAPCGLLGDVASADDQTSFHSDLRGIWGFENCTENDADFFVAHGSVAILMEITCESAQVEVRAWQMPSGEWV